MTTASPKRRFDVAAMGRAAVDHAREYFLLRELARRSDALDPALREELHTAVRLSDQRREAADLLHQHGARAEALRLAQDAYLMLARVAERAAIEVPEVAIDPELEAGRAPLEDDIVPAREARLQELLAAHSALHREVALLPLAAKERTRIRATRIAVSVAIFATLVSVLVWSLRRVAMTAEASAVHGPRYTADNAIDGNEQTEWLLPDHTKGWLDVRFVPPRPVRTISLLNAQNASYRITEYRLEAYVGETVVLSHDGKLAPAAESPFKTWVELPFATSGKVDRVRLVVLTGTVLGGGLSEIVVH